MTVSTKLHFANKEGTFIFSHEVDNANLSNTILWNFLSKKYFGTPLIELIKTNTLPEIYTLLRHRHITPDEQILLASTMPGVIMKRSDAIKYFASIMTIKEKGVVGNFPQVSISLIRGLHKGAFYVAWEYNESISNFWGDPVANKINIFTHQGIHELITLAGLNEKDK